MDEVTLGMLADAVEESAEWFGKDKGITAYNVALGRVAGLHGLERDELSEVIGETNRRLAVAESERHGQALIQSAIRNVN
jgi:hypothetical protein